MTKINFLKAVTDNVIEKESKHYNTTPNGKFTEYYTQEEINCTCCKVKFPIKYIVNYERNQKNGEGIYFHATGERYIKAFFFNDKKEKTWIWYDKNGEIIESIDFENDMKQGNLKHYENKKLIYHFIYDKNNIKEIIKGDYNEYIKKKF